MSGIRRLEISHLRNLNRVQISPSPQINILFGNNGSGKTSVLEAIHLLGLGRSFRSSKTDSVIQDGTESCTVFAELEDGVNIGLSKTRSQSNILKLHGEKQRSWVETARHLPLQVINAESFQLLEGGPKVRRRFLDWGVFHVEHSFIGSWRDTSKCLAHRNLLIKQTRLDRIQLAAWDAEFTETANKVDSLRSRYFELFLPVAMETIAELIEIEGLSLRYWRGWDDDTSLADALGKSLDKDIRYGATQQGPHRADVIVRVGKRAAAEVLSRGQQKLLVSALKIAQGRMLSSHSGINGIYLVDDLPSELDKQNRSLVCELLVRLKSQVFLSSVDASDLENTWVSSAFPRKFHVEHGKITPVDE
jgi:DNA replication and repair protein RecF